MTNPCDGYRPISDYGLIGDTYSCALVSRDGSVDWACLPDFDSRAVFSRILDKDRGGYFQIKPVGEFHVTRRYRPSTNILETTFHTPTGVAVLIDFMPLSGEDTATSPESVRGRHQLARILQCTGGRVEYEAVCEPVFDYGSIVPHTTWLSPDVGMARGGADAITFYCSGTFIAEGPAFRSTGVLEEGQSASFSVSWINPAERSPRITREVDLHRRLGQTEAFWRRWSDQLTYDGIYRDEVLRSALTLKALTYSPTGALLAAPTASLPEDVGGERNWDYRYTWVRDAAFALYALHIVGFSEEARAFKGWLEGATLGRATDLQVLYGIRGERRLPEQELDYLEGHCGSRPIRIGNLASRQFQLDIYGELLDSAHLYRKYVGDYGAEYWGFLREVVQFVIDHWREPDEGIWEVRSGRQHWVFSKAMCWVTLDRAIRAVESGCCEGPVEEWRAVRQEIRQDILEHGFNQELGAFVQAYGARRLDASVLMLPLIKFISPADPRMRSTVEAIARDLTSPQGLVYRYRAMDDGLPGPEGTFSICSFWLADNLILQGDLDRARALIEQLRNHANDLGLFSEQVDGETGAMLGNFPQAFTHVAMINAAVQLQKALDRQEREARR